MKRFIKICSTLTMIVLILALSVMPSFAAGELLVNGETALKDDVVTYTLNLGDCEEGVVGLHMFIKYDKTYLEMVENSLDFGEINSRVVHNGSNQANSDGEFIFTFTDPGTPADFSTSKLLAKVDFKVLKAGETNIEFFVTDLYGMDMTYMKNYTFTYNLAVNDETVIDGEPPVLVADQDFLNQNQGQFVNYADGKGEENGEEAVRETIMGVTTAPPTDVLKGTEEESGSGTIDLTTVIVLVAVVLIVLIIIVLVIVRNAMNRSKKQDKIEE